MSKSSVHLMSNNVFDIDFLTKKEYIEIIDNLIKTVEVLSGARYSSSNNYKPDVILSEFGILQGNMNQNDLTHLIGRERFSDLTDAMYTIECEGLRNDINIRKYDYSYRMRASIDSEITSAPTLVDLFCGAGGLSLGLSQAGFRIVFANDIERSALRTYQFNHPEVGEKALSLGGIEQIAHNVHNYIHQEVDVIAGGPPCQGFSTANRQRVIDDPRNVLYRYYVECVHNLKPKVFIMENVKGMKNVASQIIDDFNSRGTVNYDIEYNILNAKRLGIPQNRERLIFIGIRKDISEQKKISSYEVFKQILSVGNKSEVPLWDAIVDLPKLEASRVKNNTEEDSALSGGKIATRFERYHKNKYLDEINNCNDPSIIFNHKARYNNNRDIEIYKRMLPGDKSDSPRIADIMPYTSRSHMFKDKYYKLLPDVPSKTITAHMKFDCNMYIHPYQARGLTPREAARIQSYPDDYFFLGAFTKTYQQIGNSVPPLMSRIVGKVIRGFLV